jgi:hypothetical protein
MEIAILSKVRENSSSLESPIKFLTLLVITSEKLTSINNSVAPLWMSSRHGTGSCPGIIKYSLMYLRIYLPER